MTDIPLVIGHKGMLGRAWCELLTRQGREFRAVDIDEIDITNPNSVREHLVSGVGPVINCAAYTAVDQAEAEEELATRINGYAVEDLAARCLEIGAVLVHYSTDYVFHGDATTPYPTDAPHDPLNAYGRGKAIAEAALFASSAEWLLIRTSWVYAPWGKNFVKTIRALSATRDELKVIDDQRGRPTSAEHLADLSDRLLRKGARGVFHGTDGGACSWHEFASQIVENAGTDCVVHRCPTSEYPTAAKRPAFSVLDLTKTEALIGPMPPWQENLAGVMARLE